MANEYNPIQLIDTASAKKMNWDTFPKRVFDCSHHVVRVLCIKWAKGTFAIMTMILLLSFAAQAFTTPLTRSSLDLDLHYRGYSLNFNCQERTTDRFTYTLTADMGNAPRPKSFYQDPKLRKECQQFTTKSYGSGYDRGHLATSNHMDADAQTIREAHYMTNIVPQASRFNQGVWVQTEEIQECFRDLKPITVYGGVIYTDPSNDFFVKSHGIKTPDFFWKVLYTTDPKTNEPKIISWYFPNQNELGPLDDYLVSVSYIESQLNDGLGSIPVPTPLKSFVASQSWSVPQNCDKS